MSEYITISGGCNYNLHTDYEKILLIPASNCHFCTEVREHDEIC